MSLQITSEELEDYYRREVEIRKAGRRLAKAKVLCVVERIVREMHRQDDRFPEALTGDSYMGSSFQGLKVKRADEFDFDIPIQGLPAEFEWSSTLLSLRDTSHQQGYMSLRYIVEQQSPRNIQGYFTRFSNSNGELVPSKVKQWFKCNLQMALSKLYPPERM